MQSVIELGRLVRDTNTLPLKVNGIYHNYEYLQPSQGLPCLLGHQASDTSRYRESSIMYAICDRTG